MLVTFCSSTVATNVSTSAPPQPIRPVVATVGAPDHLVVRDEVVVIVGEAQHGGRGPQTPVGTGTPRGGGDGAGRRFEAQRHRAVVGAHGAGHRVGGDPKRTGRERRSAGVTGSTRCRPRREARAPPAHRDRPSPDPRAHSTPPNAYEKSQRVVSRAPIRYRFGAWLTNRLTIFIRRICSGGGELFDGDALHDVTLLHTEHHIHALGHVAEQVVLLRQPPLRSSRQMKNCEPFVSAPALAIATAPCVYSPCTGSSPNL